MYSHVCTHVHMHTFTNLCAHMYGYRYAHSYTSTMYTYTYVHYTREDVCYTRVRTTWQRRDLPLFPR